MLELRREQGSNVVGSQPVGPRGETDFTLSNPDFDSKTTRSGSLKCLRSLPGAPGGARRAQGMPPKVPTSEIHDTVTLAPPRGTPWGRSHKKTDLGLGLGAGLSQKDRFGAGAGGWAMS